MADEFSLNTMDLAMQFISFGVGITGDLIVFVVVEVGGGIGKGRQAIYFRRPWCLLGLDPIYGYY